MNNQELKGVGQFLKETWQIYCSKFEVIFKIIGIPISFGLAIQLLRIYVLKNIGISGIGYPALFTIWLSVPIAVIIFLFAWATSSLLWNIKADTSFKESYKNGLKILLPYFWIFLMAGIIISGGFLFLIIPGILFSVWFSLAIYVFIFEEKSGMTALLRSKNLISGKFWQTLGRFLMSPLIIAIGRLLAHSFIVFLLGPIKSKQISPIINYIFWFFTIPFFLIYKFLIYKNLVEIKKDIVYPKAHRKQKVIYVLLGTTGIIISLTIFTLITPFSFLNLFFGKDESVVADIDLWPSKIEIPKEENAFYYFIPYFSQDEKGSLKKYCLDERLQQPREIYLPENKSELIENIIEEKKWDEGFTQELIENNEETLVDFEKAAGCLYFQIPFYQEPKNLTLRMPDFTSSISLGIIKITRLNLIKATLLFNQGKEKKALEQVIKTIKIGQMIADSPRTPHVYYLIGKIIKNMGFKKLRIMLSRSNLGIEDLKNYMDKIGEFRLNKEGLKNILKMEYTFSVNTIDKEINSLFLASVLPKSIAKNNYFYKPNQTKRLLAEFYRSSIENVDKNYSEVKFHEFRYLRLAPIKCLFTQNIIGKIFFQLATIRDKSFHKSRCREDFLVKATQLLIAIKAYYTEKGILPKSLDEIIPKYILEIPLDPFDGKPIRYSPERKIIYSVGEDLIDSGGRGIDGLRGLEELTLRIEF